MNLRQSGVDGRVGGDQAVDVREPEEPPDGVQHGVDRGVPQLDVVQVTDVELQVRPFARRAGPSRWSRTRRTSGEAGRRTTCGSRRCSEPGRRRPRAGRASWRRAGRVGASRWSLVPPTIWRRWPGRGPPHTARSLAQTLLSDPGDVMGPGSASIDAMTAAKGRAEAGHRRSSGHLRLHSPRA